MSFRFFLRFAPFAAALAIAFGAACDGSAPPPRNPQHRGRNVKNKGPAKPAPRFAEFNLHVDRGPFLDAGCVGLDDPVLDCHEAAFARYFGCDPMMPVEDMLGGLAPPLPIAACRRAGKGVLATGCSAGPSQAYVIWREGQFELLDSTDAFVERFAPVKNPDAALAFSLALSADTRALFDLNFDDGAPVDSEVAATNVLLRPQGYVVRLFHRARCGCEHADDADDYLVTREGDVKRLDRVQVHKNPALEGRCVN